MQIVVREIRGVPLFLLKEYLQEMGGTPQGENILRAEGWSATLEKMEPFRLGSLSVGQTRLTLEIREDLAEEFLKKFSLKTLRAGG